MYASTARQHFTDASEILMFDNYLRMDYKVDVRKEKFGKPPTSGHRRERRLP